MHFIQNPDLREWVKESLRKAIFQKAHALAIQTGCEILVKLQDDSDAATGHQFYATNGLQNAFRNNRLRMHPEEKCVSGETGMPMLNQSMQVGSSEEDMMGCPELWVKGQELMVGNQAMIDAEFREQYLANGDTITQTVMHERMAQENSFDASSSADGDINSQLHPYPSTLTTQDDTNDKIPDMHIKLEKMEDEDDMEASSSCRTSQSVQGGSLPGSSPSTLTLSRSTVSINPKPYQCAVCHKAFRSVQVLQKHAQTFHARLHGGAESSTRNCARSDHIYNKLQKMRFSTLPMPPEPPDFKGFYCTMCQQDFPTAVSLYDHQTLSHMEALAQNSLEVEKSSDNNHPRSSAAKKTSTGTGTSPSCTDLQMIAASMLPSGSQQSTSTSPSSVPLFMKLPSPSTGNVAFSQSSPSGPIFSHHGLPVGLSGMSPGSSGRSKHRTYTKRLMGKQLGNRDIMSAILQTAGPVATHFTVLTASPNFILGSTYITKEQFVAAASALQDLNLGSLVTVRHVHGRPSVNFVKKPPSDAKEALEIEANRDLCTLSLYDEKYKTATPACVPQGTRDKLISLGLVTQEDFK